VVNEECLERHIKYDAEHEIFVISYGGMIARATTKDKAITLVKELIKTYDMRMGE